MLCLVSKFRIWKDYFKAYSTWRPSSRLCLRKLPQYSRRVQDSLLRDIRRQLGPFSVACFLTGFVLTSPNSLLQQYCLLISGIYFWNLFTFKWVSNGEPTFFVSIQSPFCFLVITLTNFLHLWLHSSLLKAACCVGGSAWLQFGDCVYYCFVCLW